MDADTKDKILTNQLFVKVNAEEANKINQNASSLSAPIQSYFFNQNLATQELKNKPIDFTNTSESTGRMLANIRYYPQVKENKEQLEKKEKALAIEDYKNSGFINQAIESYKAGRAGLESSRAWWKYANAVRSGDTLTAEAYRRQAQGLEEKQAGYIQEGEGSTAESFGNILASYRDYAPWYVGLGLVGTAATAATGGVGAPLIAGSQKIAQGFATYYTTYGAEAGSTFRELDVAYPDMDFEDKYQISKMVGSINGIIEAVGFEGAATTFKPLIRPLTREIARRVARKEISSAVLSNPTFIRELSSALKPWVVGGTAVAIGAASEGSEEALQNAVNRALNKALESGEDVQDITSTEIFGDALKSVGGTLERLATGQELTPEDNENIKSFSGAAKGSALLETLFGLGARGGARAINYAGDRAERFKLKRAATRLAEGNTNLAKAEQYMEANRNNTMRKDSPDANALHTQYMVEDGLAPEYVNMDADAAIQLMAEAQDDQNLAAQVAMLDLPNKIQEAQQTDGTVRFKFEEADQIIFNPEDETLFQKIKNNLTFDDSTLSAAGAKQFAENLLGENKRLREQINKSDSLMRDVYNQLKQTMPEDRALANAAVLQHAIDSMRTFSNQTLSEEELLKKIGLQIRVEREQREPQPKINKGLFGTKKVGKAKVRTKKIDTSKIAVDEVKGAGVPYVPEVAQQSFLFEDKKGNLTPLTGERQFAVAKLNNDKGLKANVISEKDGITLEEAQDEVLKQTVPTDSGDIIAGYVDTRDMANQLLALTKNSNPTTMSHEVFHLFFKNLVNQYNIGDLREYWTKQLKTAADWVGAKQVDGKYVFTTEQQEKLADGFTDYLLKGKAPVSRLNALFDLFRELFAKVYAVLRRKPFKLNKRITKVYDSIFLSYGEAIDIQTEERYGILQKPDNVSNEEFEDYIALVRESRKQASTTIADSVELINDRRKSKEYKEKVKQYYNEYLPQVQADPKHQAYAYVAENKIDKLALEQAGLSLRSDMVKEGGKQPDAIVKQYGFEDVADLVEFLNESLSSEETAMASAEESADAWLVDEFPELRQVDIQNATRNIATIKAQIQEAMMLRGLPLKDFNQYYNEMVLSAERVINNTKVPEITNVEKLLKRLNIITEKYRIAENNGDKVTMSKMRYRSAVVNYMIMRGNMIRKDIKKFDRHFRRYKKRPTNFQLKYIEGQVWDIITAVLHNFQYTAKKPANMTDVTQRISDYADMIAQEGYNMSDTMRTTAVFLSNRANLKPAKLTTADFYTINGALRLLESASKKRQYMMVQEKEFAFQDMAQETLDNIAKTRWKPVTDRNVLAKMTLGFSVMPEVILEKLFAPSAFKNLVLPFMDGFQKARLWETQKSQQLKDIIDPITQYDKQIFEIDGRRYTGEELSVMVLHIGNSHNKDCLLETLKQKFGEKFNETDLETLINGIPKVYRSYAQAIWDSFDENVQQFREAQHRITGAEIKLVEAEPIVFSDGERLKGGYYPVSIKNLGTSKDYGEQKTFKTDGVFPTFGFQQERTLQPHGDLDLSLKPLQSYVTKMSQVLYVAEHYNNLQSFMRRPEIRNAIGDEGVKMFSEWAHLATMPEHVNRALAWWDNILSVAVLGLSPAKALIQMCGFIPAMRRVGMTPMIESLARNLNPIRLREMDSFIQSKSAYITNRFNNPENHIADIRRLDFLSTKVADKGMAGLTKIAMIFIEAGDRWASIITWDAEYNRALQAGETEQNAILLADEAVRTTQGDTSAGSRPKMLQGNLRYMTKFASYFVAIHSRVVAEYMTGDWVGAAMTLVMGGVISSTAEVLMSAWYQWYFADDDEKKKWRKKGIKDVGDLIVSRTKENALGSTLNIIIPHFGIGGGLGTYSLENKEYAPQVQALTRMFDAAKIPVDIAKIPLTDSQKEQEKLYKRLRRHVFSLLPVSEKRFMSAWDYVKGF